MMPSTADLFVQQRGTHAAVVKHVAFRPIVLLQVVAKIAPEQHEAEEEAYDFVQRKDRANLRS